ncbi:MAG: ABC transporter ATP-binding protein/permease [Bacilli bacterium]|nr:ABC transporter ATP-binding protein/permease [Bacilli bacterium]MCH4236145.1 ABC transporter ATP-binding protein/permease [Bacilli bacterium]
MGMGGRVGHGGFAPGEKAKDFKGSVSKLFSYGKSFVIFGAIAIILAITGTILNIIGPQKIGDITDYIVNGITGTINLPEIKKLAIFLIVIYGLGFIFNYIQSYIMATIAQRLSYKLRRDIDHKINRLPLKYFDNNSYGDVLSRVTNDVDTIAQTLNQSLGTLVSAITMFFGSLIMMFITNYIMAFAAVASTLIGFLLMIIIIKKSQKYFLNQQNGLGAINGHIEEVYSGHTIVKAYNGEKAALKSFNRMNDDLFINAWRSQFLSGLMMPIMQFIGNFGYVVVSIVGALLAINGKIQFGVIASFMLYIRLFTQPMSQFAQAANRIQSGAAASERVFSFLDEPELNAEFDKTKALQYVKGDVEFNHVKFGYDSDKIIIPDFSMKAKAGQKIAIVGPTGAGKTTLVNLLMRFYEVEDGQIKIDGTSTLDVPRENVHDQFCMVLQDTWLFEGTIKENIAYNRKGVTDEMVKEACKVAGIDFFIRTLPNGYETILTDKLNLSAGQKQLITIARAMIVDAPLLILDEATSSVDTRTEIIIQKAMDRLMHGRTSFVIAHRLSTIKNADLILVLKDGNVVESGTHVELLSKNGFYADLYNSQFDAMSE